MIDESLLLKLQEIVSKCDSSILYNPTKKEIDYNNHSFPLEIPTDNLCIPKDKFSDPFEWADTCIEKLKDKKVWVLIPGTQFDKYGTRYGKGFGWYDRFLSKLPSKWLRVGIIDKSKFSQNKLVRQSWDQPVNWVLVHDNSSWTAYKA